MVTLSAHNSKVLANLGPIVWDVGGRLSMSRCKSQGWSEWKKFSQFLLHFLNHNGLCIVIMFIIVEDI